jgi:hypothetical protein
VHLASVATVMAKSTVTHGLPATSSGEKPRAPAKQSTKEEEEEEEKEKKHKHRKNQQNPITVTDKRANADVRRSSEKEKKKKKKKKNVHRETKETEATEEKEAPSTSTSTSTSTSASTTRPAASPSEPTETSGEGGDTVDLGAHYEITARFLCSRSLPCWRGSHREQGRKGRKMRKGRNEEEEKEEEIVYEKCTPEKLYHDEEVTAEDATALSHMLPAHELAHLHDLELSRTATELEVPWCLLFLSLWVCVRTYVYVYARMCTFLCV